MQSQVTELMGRKAKRRLEKTVLSSQRGRGSVKPSLKGRTCLLVMRGRRVFFNLFFSGGSFNPFTVVLYSRSSLFRSRRQSWGLLVLGRAWVDPPQRS